MKLENGHDDICIDSTSAAITSVYSVFLVIKFTFSFIVRKYYYVITDKQIYQ